VLTCAVEVEFSIETTNTRELASARDAGAMVPHA